MNDYILGSIVLFLIGILLALTLCWSRGINLIRPLIRLAYHWARFWWAVACGLDDGYVAFRRKKRELVISPASEAELAADIDTQQKGTAHVDTQVEWRYGRETDRQ